jgi:GNAT superfamily N-acetyltransferase
MRPKVSYGLFCPVVPSSVSELGLTTLESAKPAPDSPGTVLVLLAHMVGTLGPGPVVTDNDMDWTRDWRNPEALKAAKVGHQTTGRTVCLHSFAVLPELHGRGVGALAMQMYLDAQRASKVANRVAILCQDVSESPHQKRSENRHN